MSGLLILEKIGRSDQVNLLEVRMVQPEMDPPGRKWADIFRMPEQGCSQEPLK
jgi:hypothetical protein